MEGWERDKGVLQDSLKDCKSLETHSNQHNFIEKCFWLLDDDWKVFGIAVQHGGEGGGESDYLKEQASNDIIVSESPTVWAKLHFFDSKTQHAPMFCT